MSSSSSGSTLLPADWINQTVDGQQYDVLLPANYNPSTKYPTILYLHQLDAGNDPTSLVNEVNGWFNTSDFRSNYPAVIVMPILDQTSDPSGNTNNWGGVSGDKPGTQFAIDALKAVQSQYSTDSSRTYVTGPSMGGQGTDQMMQDYGPNSATPIFAAGYSMAGMMANETPQQFYAAISNAPMEAVHGTADTTNPPGFDQGLAAIDPNFHLTQVQGVGHDVWDPQPNAGIAGYSNDAAWTWLFQQQLGGTSNSGSGNNGGGSVSGSTAGTRDPSQIPFASNSVFNLPFGTGAQWTPNSQLESAGLVINTANVTGYTEDIYTGTASDPVITVTNQAGAGGTPGVFQVHIPAGAVPASGNDRTFSVDDEVTHTWYSFGQWTWTGPNSATVQQGSGEPDYGSGISVDNSDWDEGVGTLRESDLQAGAINHMLRIEIPSDMALSYSNTSTNVLAPNAWPQTAEDGYANNGQGGAPYTGTIPYGATIGIPDNVAEPADIKANAGANMLWQEMQTHGAMVRDTTDTSNEGKITFQADQNVNGNDPLILGMEQYGAEILSYAQILANQGPNSVNGGGTPILPLDPNPNDLPGGSGGGGGTTGGGGSGSTPSPSGTTITPGVGVITDAAGNLYNILPDGATYENQQPMAGGGNTGEMEYYNGQIYGQDATSQTWYTWNQTTWTAASAPSTGSGGGSAGGGGTTTPPSSGTIITPGSGTLTDSSGNTYTLSSQDVAMENGNAIPGGWGTGEMEYYNGQIYGQDATSQTWYTWNQTSWTSAAAPPGPGSTNGVAAMAVGPTPVTLAANQLTYVDSTGNVAVSATAGDHTVFLNGSGDSADLTGGNESLTTTSNNSIVTGSGNDAVVASGTGNSVSLGTGNNVFTDNGSNNDLILAPGGVTAAKGQFATNGDTFDMRQVMAATDWNDQTSTLNNYLSLTQAGGFTSVGVSNTSGGTATQVALIQGSLTAAQFETRALFH